MDFIEPCFGIGHNLSLICQMTSEDIKHQLITKADVGENVQTLTSCVSGGGGGGLSPFAIQVLVIRLSMCMYGGGLQRRL